MSYARAPQQAPARLGGGALLVLACLGLATNAALGLLAGVVLAVSWPVVLPAALVLLVVLGARGRRLHRRRRRPVARRRSPRPRSR